MGGASDPAGAEVFSVVGIDLGPPKALVLPTLLGRDRLLMEPANIQLVVSVYKCARSGLWA